MRFIMLSGDMMRFHTIFFDLDGTLLDHFEAIHRAHCHTRKHFGLSEPSMDEVHRAVGAGVDVAVTRIFAHDRPDLVSQALPVYKEFWDENMLDGVRLLAGARELLETLNRAGVCCAVLTNKHGPSSRKVCEHLGVAHLLKGIFGAADTPWLKPQNEFTAHALNALGKSDAAARVGNAGGVPGVCLVGDSIYDAQTGVNGGFPCYCVTTGTHTAEALREAGAIEVHADLPELAKRAGL
ncbi:phosphoglycolate phosphatase [Ereboglobus sp. PH5-5]|uniref:HAD family hydrolase n=1 Tax=Ereboglobus sp. PH5-5 TaxID=2940529 RepID=UPI002405655F|nr:HAD family hydrolase [Ereboglobus sp. PH5-5]MDF9832610.1 phosphoglycolate phosphatase [Ereboglobus sp. PH5-5]